jgi:hypothetical protein
MHLFSLKIPFKRPIDDFGNTHSLSLRLVMNQPDIPLLDIVGLARGFALENGKELIRPIE